MPKPPDESWRPPSGRHGIPREIIVQSQRERLLDAMVRVTAEKGYGATTVADVTKRAGVSRTTFYELFQDKEDCFLAAYDRMMNAYLDRLADACETQEEWPARMAAGLMALLAAFSEDPQVARLALVEVSAAGPAAQRRYRAALQRVTPLVDEGRDFVSGGRALPPSTARMAIGAVAGLIADELVSGRGAELMDRYREVLFATLLPYLGPEAAEELAEKAG